MLHLMKVVEEGDLLGHVLESERLHPQKVLRRPAPHSRRSAETAPEKKLPQAVSRTQLVLLCCLPRPDRVAQGLMGRNRPPPRRQVPGAVAPRQLLRVA